MYCELSPKRRLVYSDNDDEERRTRYKLWKAESRENTNAHLVVHEIYQHHGSTLGVSSPTSIILAQP